MHRKTKTNYLKDIEWVYDLSTDLNHEVKT